MPLVSAFVRINEFIISYALSIGIKVVDNLKWPCTASWIFLELGVTSQIWEATTAKRMKINPKCQRH